MRREQRRRGTLRPVAYTKGPERWQVSYFSGRTERVQVLIDDTSGRVREAWTGPQVAWEMARGYPGAFAGRVSALYIWLPLCVVSLAPFVDLRRPRRLLHLDLAAILAFGVSLAFFNHANIAVSVPLTYPPLVYLMVRLLVLARSRGRPSGRLIPRVPLTWLALALVFLLGFRVALNVSDSSVIDVGYAGVIGADRILDGHGLYDGTFAPDNQNGGTYGPANYLAYVPFVAVFGWSGHWDTLAAAHAAALTFDLLTVLGLFMLGARARAGPAGRELGLALAFAWAANPFTLFVLDSNSNDSLVALALVGALLALTSPAGRGATAALAAATKFAPLALVPLLVRGTSARDRRGFATALLTLGAVAAALFLPFIPHGGFSALYEKTLGYQAGRGSPFSIWGQYPSLAWLLTLLRIATVGLALLLAWRLRRRGRAQCAALGAALLIATQLCAAHWFYLYIVWFLPLALFALLSAHETGPRSPAQLDCMPQRALTGARAVAAEAG
ncbi:MAG: hypothetical protein NVS2B6_14830 [Thermoleophilaceae bacterium]